MTKLDPQALDLTLLSNFLHQVVNPLNGVCGTLDNITENQVPPGSVTQRLKVARAQIEHCIALVRNLAYFAEISRDAEGYKERHAGKVSTVPKIILEAAMFFQESARRKKMNIFLLDRETQFKINADPDLIRQIFMNLFDNCVKYGNANSDIIIKPRVQKKTGDLIVEVVNSGPPVPAELWESIFELGFRGENARRIVASGTGLGLYICRAIAAVYGGSVSYTGRSSPQESTFTLRIPGGYV